MILRRITEHVKAQNWTAVALDFVIVVVGVFMGIQLGNWNDARADAALTNTYYERLIGDLEADRAMYENRITAFGQIIKEGRIAARYEVAPKHQDEAWLVIRSFFQPSHVLPFLPAKGTYEEILNAGDLKLIDGDITTKLTYYHRQEGITTVSTPPYREHVRSIIPFHIQLYLQTECYNVVLPSRHSFLECPPPDTEEDLIALAVALLNDERITSGVRYALSLHQISSNLSYLFNGLALELIDDIEAKRNERGGR